MKPHVINSKEAINFITERDEYISNFSQFDLQSRLGTSEKVSIGDFLQFLSLQTIDWTNLEKEIVEKIFMELNEAYSKFKQYLPDNVILIKTTGKEEGDAAYTRGSCIYIPLSMVQYAYEELKELIAHELFHVISTDYPKFRYKWYRKLGFVSCPELEIPKEYEELYVSNPDTTGKNCYVEFQHNGGMTKAIPFLYSKQNYQGGYFFKYFRFAYLVSEIQNNKCIPVYEGENAIFIEAPEKLYNLCEEIDPYNNQHRLHPEEILAYYWSFLPFSESELGNEKRQFLLKIHTILH